MALRLELCISLIGRKQTKSILDRFDVENIYCICIEQGGHTCIVDAGV